MIKSIIWYLHFAVTLLMEYPRIRKITKEKGTIPQDEYRAKAKRLIERWADKQIRFAGVSEKAGTLEIIGKENIPYDRPALYVANHQGNFDPAMLLAYLDVPASYIAKRSLDKMPFINIMMDNIDVQYIDRDDPKQQIQVVLNSIKMLKDENYSVVVFPEGTRGDGPALGEFKAGTFKIATKAKVPVVPITLNGTYDIMEANNNKISKANVQMVIHKPIETAEMTKEEQKQLHIQAKETIASALWQR